MFVHLLVCHSFQKYSENRAATHKTKQRRWWRGTKHSITYVNKTEEQMKGSSNILPLSRSVKESHKKVKVNNTISWYGLRLDLVVALSSFALLSSPYVFAPSVFFPYSCASSSPSPFLYLCRNPLASFSSEMLHQTAQHLVGCFLLPIAFCFQCTITISVSNINSSFHFVSVSTNS